MMSFAMPGGTDELDGQVLTRSYIVSPTGVGGTNIPTSSSTYQGGVGGASALNGTNISLSFKFLCFNNEAEDEA